MTIKRSCTLGPYGLLTQWLEIGSYKLEVVGSNPTGPTNRHIKVKRHLYAIRHDSQDELPTGSNTTFLDVNQVVEVVPNRYCPKRRNTLSTGQINKTRLYIGAIVKELRSILDAPPLPFYVLILLVDTKVLYTSNMLVWRRGIKAHKDEQTIFFPVSQDIQLEELKLYYSE